MKLLSTVLCLSIIGVVVADYGYFVPKAFYKINENGERSPLYYIDLPEQAISQRFKRSAQFNQQHAGASVSTSSGSSGGGGINFLPPLFPLPFGNQGFGGPIGQNQGFGGGGGGSSTFSGISTSTSTGGGNVGLNSRFGEDDGPVITGQTHTISGHNGVFTQTTQQLGSDGKLHTTVQKGRY